VYFFSPYSFFSVLYFFLKTQTRAQPFTRSRFLYPGWLKPFCGRACWRIYLQILFRNAQISFCQGSSSMSIYVVTYIFVWVWLWEYMSMAVYISVYVSGLDCMCLCIWVCVCERVCVCVCTHEFVNTSTYSKFCNTSVRLTFESQITKAVDKSPIFHCLLQAAVSSLTYCDRGCLGTHDV
jgi:hypothetical protein